MCALFNEEGKFLAERISVFDSRWYHCKLQ